MTKISGAILFVALVIAGSVLTSGVWAIKLNLNEICTGTSKFVCTISHINGTFQDPIVLTNDSHSNLRELILRNSQLARLPSKLFSLTPKLQSLIVHNCALNRFNTNDFKETIKLFKLVIQKNRLFELSEKMFILSPILKELQLSSNTVHLVHRLAFTGLVHLESLSLQDNVIEVLPRGVFVDLVNLKYIDLSNNRIEKIDAETFAQNEKLHTILLNDNSFKVFEPNSLEHLSRLRMLDVSNNKMEELRVASVDTMMAQNTELKKLIISGSVIKLHAGNYLSGISIDDKSSILELELHGNLLETLDDFVGMFSLQRLNISNNKLKSLGTTNSSLYLPLPNLVTLNLAFNQLQNLSADNFILLQKLTYLDLAFNDLQSLDYRIFEPLRKLEQLYIEGNHLHSFEYVPFVQAHKSLKEFGIYINNWYPETLQEMLAYLGDNAIEVITRFQLGSNMMYRQKTIPLLMPSQDPVPNCIDANKKSENINDKAGVSGIHPYFTFRDYLALAVLAGVFIVICLQFYTILREEGCLPLRCCCTREDREYNRNMIGRPQRLDEDDSEM